MKIYTLIRLTFVAGALAALAGPAWGDDTKDQMRKELGLDKERLPATGGWKTRGAGGGTTAPTAPAGLTRSGVVLPRGAKRVSPEELAALRDKSKPLVAPSKARIDSAPVIPEKVVVYKDSNLNLQVLFKLNSAEFRDDDAEGLGKLQTLAKLINEEPDRKFLVEGHTCDLGEADYNDRLSWARAEMVRLFLIREGVEPRQIRTLGCGEREAPTHLVTSDRSPATETVRKGCRRVVVREVKE